MNTINQNGTAPLIKRRLYKYEVARVLDMPRSQQIIDCGYIDQEVLNVGHFPDIEAYKRAHLLNFNVIDLIFQKSGVTWEYAYHVLGY